MSASKRGSVRRAGASGGPPAPAGYPPVLRRVQRQRRSCPATAAERHEGRSRGPFAAAAISLGSGRAGSTIVGRGNKTPGMTKEQRLAVP